jgi:hypothetical protein
MNATVGCTMDVDECALGTARCEPNSYCFNTKGGHMCPCNPGYAKDSNSICADVNECLTLDDQCSQSCINTVGSYQCTCRDGYRLDGPHDCIDVDECREKLDDCSDVCVNTAGSYQCSCSSGFMFFDDHYCAHKRYIIRFRLRLNMIWDVLLYNTRSQTYRSLQATLIKQLSNAFVKLVHIKTVYVANFRMGSVEFDLVAESDQSSPVTPANYSVAANALIEYLKNNSMQLDTGPASKTTVDPPRLYTADDNDTLMNLTTPCSVYDAYHLCANGSVCIYPDSEAVCQCAQGFSGQFCDMLDDSDTHQAMIIGLSVMAAVIFIMLVGCCLYCCYVRRFQWIPQHKRRAAYEQTPSEYSGEGPEDNSGNLKNRLTPQWASEYTTPMYRYHDHTKPAHQAPTS